jgi:hypothetical protein
MEFIAAFLMLSRTSLKLHFAGLNIYMEPDGSFFTAFRSLSFTLTIRTRLAS